MYEQAVQWVFDPVAKLVQEEGEVGNSHGRSGSDHTRAVKRFNPEKLTSAGDRSAHQTSCHIVDWSPPYSRGSAELNGERTTKKRRRRRTKKKRRRLGRVSIFITVAIARTGDWWRFYTRLRADKGNDEKIVYPSEMNMDPPSPLSSSTFPLWNSSIVENLPRSSAVNTYFISFFIRFFKYLLANGIMYLLGFAARGWSMASLSGRRSTNGTFDLSTKNRL